MMKVSPTDRFKDNYNRSLGGQGTRPSSIVGNPERWYKAIDRIKQGHVLPNGKIRLREPEKIG